MMETPSMEEKIIQYLAGGDYELVAQYFDANVKKVLSAVGLKQSWNLSVSALGTFASIEKCVGPTIHQNYKISVFSLKFSNGTIDVRLVLDSEGKLAGIFFFNAQQSSESYHLPAFIDTEKIEEIKLVVGKNTDWELDARLTYPKGKTGPFVGLILVHGSGSHDFDETIYVNKPFKDIAYGLPYLSIDSKHPIAVLRYNKRTQQYPAKWTNEMTMQDETVNDALEAIKLLKTLTDPNIHPDQIFVLGHSQGGYVLPLILNQAGKDCRGGISLAGSCRKLQELILEQTEYLCSIETEPDNKKAIQEQLENIRPVVEQLNDISYFAKLDANSKVLLGTSPAYWKFLHHYNAGEEALKCKQPMLMLQGERDYQVKMKADFMQWKKYLENEKRVQFQSYPYLNHLFQKFNNENDTEQTLGTPIEYKERVPVDKQPMDDIVRWIENVIE